MIVSIETLDAPWHRTMREHDFALINTLQVEPEARADLDGLSLAPARHSHQAELFPLLIELRALGEAQRIALLDRMSAWQASRGTPYFGALLACADAAHVLARHLVKRADVVLPDGTKDVLRLHDPRLFRHLAWVFRPEQHAALLANIRCWTWPEPGGTWRSMRHSEASPAWRTARLRIDDVQWAQLRRLGDLRIVLANLQASGAMTMPHGTLAPRVDAALAQAETLPNATAQDRQLFAEHRVRFGEQLPRHPQFHARMALVLAGQQGYFAAFASLDDATLAAWAASPETAKECV